MMMMMISDDKIMMRMVWVMMMVVMMLMMKMKMENANQALATILCTFCQQLNTSNHVKPMLEKNPWNIHGVSIIRNPATGD
jgi:hypothetical protein